ncbi:CotD family spore coat protein [Priestia aryabhattai]|uniref:CotD family spore coat protein n=1 Tax=Priestia aryabhattai TaxID=412384 RepID=UPI000BF23FF9|nr:CotD family spore coat protein [Priestia aryabhattai]MED3947134.1 CotD family spore coat protein [Priestia aryabhattai]PEI60123.1 hypothetical protein CN635_04900 [Priestia aryabhattai]
MRNNYPYQHSNYGGYHGAMYPQQGNCGYPQAKPCGQLPPQTMPAQYDPVKQNTSFTGQDVFVPVVHPSHTTNVYQKNYKYMHSFPHTESVVCQETHQHFCAPSCPPRPRLWY